MTYGNEAKLCKILITVSQWHGSLLMFTVNTVRCVVEDSKRNRVQCRPARLSYLFHHYSRKQSKTSPNGTTLQIACYCVESLFSQRLTALHSASPPVYEHSGTLHCGSSLPINLYLSVSVEWRADISQMLQLRQHFHRRPQHCISPPSTAPFFIRSSAASLAAFIFIACVYTQLSHGWFKCISVGIRAQELL